jgi:hypothetical protein
MSNEPRTCPNCGIFYYEWLQQDPRAFFTPNVEAPEPLIPNIHECPEPYPYKQAQALAALYGSAGIPVSQTTKARIKLGLRRPF